MSESLIDNVQRKLLEKISNQAVQLGSLNNDLRDAVEYIKICDLRLASFEDATSAVQSQRDSFEQSDLENKALVQKLLLEGEDKRQKHIQCEKKLGESRREVQKIRVQLETAQHSLRLASQPSDQVGHENQLKVNARLRSEVMALNSKIRSYKDQLEAIRSVPLQQGTFEVLSINSKAVRDTATLGELVSNNQSKLHTPNGINKEVKQGAINRHSLVDVAANDRYSLQSYKNIVNQDHRQCTSQEGEGEIIGGDAASEEISAKLKTVEDERDALLDYIQEDLTKNTEVVLQLKNCQMELSDRKNSCKEMKERATVLEGRFDNEVMRTSMLVSDLNSSQMHATKVEEQFRIESAHKSEEAKKGAFIISVLTSELKTARSRLVELEEEIKRNGAISPLEQLQQQQQEEQHHQQQQQQQQQQSEEQQFKQHQRVPVDTPLAATATATATGFEHSRKLTIELLSLRRLRDEWELERTQRPRAIDAALSELTTDLTALAEHDRLCAPHKEKNEISIKLGAPLPSSSASASDAVAATRGQLGYSDRYVHLSQSSDPNYMRSCSSSRNNPRGRTNTSTSKSSIQPCLEDELSSARLSKMHAYWLALPSIGIVSPLLHTKIKELASDLLYMELANLELEENIRITNNEAELSSATDKIEISKLTSLNYTLEKNLEGSKKCIEKLEIAMKNESGLQIILDNIVTALLASPGGVDRLLDDELLNSISSREFVLSKRREEKNILQRMFLEESSGTFHLGPIPDPQQYCSNCKELYLSTNTPAILPYNYSLQRESIDVSAASVCKGRAWDRTLSDLPDIVTRIVLIASTALLRLQEDEADRATAFSILKKCQSALRISNDEYDHLSRQMEGIQKSNKVTHIAMQEKEIKLNEDLDFAIDLVESQNAHIATSEAKLQAMEREVQLLYAQLTASNQKSTFSNRTLHKMLLSFAQSSGLDLGSSSIDLVPDNFEQLLEYARFLFSELLQSAKQVVTSSNQLKDLHSRVDKGAMSATIAAELMNRKARYEESYEDGNDTVDNVDAEGGRPVERCDCVFSKDDSRYIDDDEITENKALNESLLAAYLPIIRGVPRLGLGSESKGNDSERNFQLCNLRTSQASMSLLRPGAVSDGVASVSGLEQYSQRGGRSSGENRDRQYSVSNQQQHPSERLQQCHQQEQKQEQEQEQEQEGEYNCSTDVEMTSTDFIRYLRAKRKDGSDSNNSPFSHGLLRSCCKHSTGALG